MYALHLYKVHLGSMYTGSLVRQTSCALVHMCTLGTQGAAPGSKLSPTRWLSIDETNTHTGIIRIHVKYMIHTPVDYERRSHPYSAVANSVGAKP